jgi:hypothetical protein
MRLTTSDSDTYSGHRPGAPNLELGKRRRPAEAGLHKRRRDKS